MKQRSALCRAGSLLLFPVFLAAAYAHETVALGPVEQVNLAGSSLTVLGQTFELTPTLTVTFGGKRYTISDALRVVHAGTYISVVGTDTPGGRPIAKEIIISRRPYVPGANDVFVSGIVSSYDASTGQANIGKLQIDATSMFASNSSFTIGVGTRIEVFGKQAIAGGAVLASELKLVQDASTGAPANVQSISGTGAANIQSISGTGAVANVQSISGTGAATNKQSISGTRAVANVQSISGTGAATNRQSISGTGAAANVQSISGTGAATNKQSISGTGAAANVQSISGTGAAANVQSISGTGAAANVQSISGTGAAANVQSISGTGAATNKQSISGTGSAANAQSISGTGAARSVLSISGTGIRTLIN
jgi:hypothetical protein